ncbi:MAG: hypothetical protein AB4426_29730 [Xenococcaceae cyanobacterium]
MSQANLLIGTTVDLFLYDLYNGIGQSAEQIKENRRRFWQRIYEDKLSEEVLAESQAESESVSGYIELLGDKRIEKLDHPFDGYYYPVKLGDTYALQIDCSGEENNPNWDNYLLEKQLEIIIQEGILKGDETQQLPGEMGQSWLLWGKMATSSQNPEATAQECYKALPFVTKSNWKRNCKGQGKFQGASFFELEHPQSAQSGMNRNYHIIICLFPYEQAEEEIKITMGKLYRHFIRLFHYRNKIIWIYEQSLKLKETLKDASGSVKKIVDSLSDCIAESLLNLNQLQQYLASALSVSYYYETNLGYLQEHYSTIEVNIGNYQNRVQVLAKQDPNSDLAFLERFEGLATGKYLTQINTDYKALSAGLKPLENFIKTMEGIIEIEKAKNERILSRTVAIASVGIGTASITASTLSWHAEKIVNSILTVPANQATPPRNLWTSFGLVFLLSLVTGLLGAVITWRFLSRGTKRSWLRQSGRSSN